MRTLCGFCLCLALTNCTVGPDFIAPTPPTAERYTSAPLQEHTASTTGLAGNTQHLTETQEIPAEWWTLFHNEALNTIIKQALSNSPTIVAAEARLRQAQENKQAATGLLLPQVDGTAGLAREKSAPAAFGASFPSTIFTLYNASVSVSYSIDVFGSTRRQIEALDAEAEYQQFELKAAHLSLAANLTTLAFKEASLRAQIDAVRQVIHVEEELLKVTEKQLAIGSASKKDILAQSTQLEQTKATLPPLENALEQVRHQLAVYMGKLTSDSDIPTFHLDSFTLPAKLPISLPSELVRQRPDIRAAEAQLRASNAQIGVATANMFPHITLSANYGPEATSIKDLFTANAMAWSLGPSLTQPIFNGGRLTAQHRAAQAVYDEAYANYQQTVLQAFQNVADVLKALESDAKTLQANARATEQANSAYNLTKQQFSLGGASYRESLNAEHAYLQTRPALATAQTARFADTAALFQALGGADT